MSDTLPIDLNSAAFGIGRHVSGIANPFNGHIDEHPLAEYEMLRDGIHGLRFVVVDAAYHNITDAIPDRCARKLHAFLTAPRACAGS